ncbi:DUF4870 domain-containing protein [Microbacterium lacus]|uniref:DUF4870 domain-containing protein n=1 Tax=Microbacterium lacus TaxID=415217 RepID=UPI00384D2F85
MTNPPAPPTPPNFGGATPPNDPQNDGQTPPYAAPPQYSAPQNYAPPQNYAAPSNVSQAPMSQPDEKMWSTLIHLGGLFFGFLAPLIGYLLFKDRGPFVRAHSATALNFQLTLIIAYIVGAILFVFVIGIFIMLAAYVLNIVFCIIAAIKANRGEWYQYPLTIKFLS